MTADRFEQGGLDVNAGGGTFREDVETGAGAVVASYQWKRRRG